MSGLPQVGIDRLAPLLDRAAVIDAVRGALIAQARGQVQSPLPGQLLFDAPHGDCHIKFGHLKGAETFAIKVATGFYDNPGLGLPVNHGLILVLSARTGAPVLLLKDDGWLTAWRTAAATALAAQALAAPGATRVGIVGTGLQARLAAEWLPLTLGPVKITFCGRDPGRTATLAAELGARATTSVADLVAGSDIVVTATPARAPLFDADLARPGQHFVGLGADSPGKQELPPALFARAARIATDDLAQALDHGDYGAAVRAGAIGGGGVALGDILDGSAPGRAAPGDITIADLTGIAAEDIAIAALFAARLG